MQPRRGRANSPADPLEVSQSRWNDLSGNRAGLGRGWNGGRRIGFGGFGHIQAGAQVIGRAFFQACVRNIAASQQNLTAGRKLNVMRDVQILERLLRDPLKDRR